MSRLEVLLQREREHKQLLEERRKEREKKKKEREAEKKKLKAKERRRKKSVIYARNYRKRQKQIKKKLLSEEKRKERRILYANSVKEKAEKKKLEAERMGVKDAKHKELFYRLIITSDKRKVQVVQNMLSLEGAYKLFNEMIEENKREIVFPVKHINNQWKNGCVAECDYELIILQLKPADEESVTKVKDKTGKNVEHEVVSDSNRWQIIEKHPYMFEESFWVYGFNPRTQRKSFTFIYDTFIASMKEKPLELIRIMVYNNKLIIQYDDDIDLVICKNKDDCIRLYNAIEEKCVKDKIKNVFFVGMITRSTSKFAQELIAKKTNWNTVKILRTSTRP